LNVWIVVVLSSKAAGLKWKARSAARICNVKPEQLLIVIQLLTAPSPHPLKGSNAYYWIISKSIAQGALKLLRIYKISIKHNYQPAGSRFPEESGQVTGMTCKWLCFYPRTIYSNIKIASFLAMTNKHSTAEIDEGNSRTP